jgi:hypothetical protein
MLEKEGTWVALADVAGKSAARETKYHLPRHKAITTANRESNFAGYNRVRTLSGYNHEFAGSTIWPQVHLHLKMGGY